ncbi:MAG: hypothetical protein ACLRQF_13685 [Thomasclavelia ramosa]
MGWNIRTFRGARCIGMPANIWSRSYSVQGLIAGGKEAFTTAIEGAEDSKEIAVDDLKNRT